jgi:hypothetical protein
MNVTARFFVTALASASLFASACLSGTVTLGTDTASHGSGGGTGTGTGTGSIASDAGDGPYAGSNLVPEGSMVLVVFEAGPPPNLGLGGTLADGIYDLSATTIYQSQPTTQQFYGQESIRITGRATLLEYVSSIAATAISETIAPAGAALNPTTTCHVGTGQQVGPNYTTTADEVSIVNGLHVDVFTRRL